MKDLSKQLKDVTEERDILKKAVAIWFKRALELKNVERGGLIYSSSYVGVLMKKMGFKSVLRRKFTTTTDSIHSFPIAGNVLDWSFESLEIGERSVSNITYIRVNDRGSSLTTIIDFADIKVIVWSLKSVMTTKNTFLKAWLPARVSSDIQQGLIVHSDRCIQYA